MPASVKKRRARIPAKERLRDLKGRVVCEIKGHDPESYPVATWDGPLEGYYCARCGVDWSDGPIERIGMRTWARRLWKRIRPEPEKLDDIWTEEGDIRFE